MLWVVIDSKRRSQSNLRPWRVTAHFVIAINALAGGSPMLWWGLEWSGMHLIAVLAAFAFAILSRLRTSAFLFFTGRVSVRTYIFVVGPLALGAFLIAFLIPETSAFAP
jgi:hypothetical protein